MSKKEFILSILITFALASISLAHAMQSSEKDRTSIVSYLYYPYWGDAGHAELEIDGQCWTLKSGGCTVRSLQERIEKREGGFSDSLPFYRYIITVTPEELKQLKEHIGKKSFYSFICSLEALTELAQNADFNVPFPFRLSPLISAHYLSYVKARGSKRIEKIEFYDNAQTHHLISLGIQRESAIIGMVIVVISYVGYVILVLCFDLGIHEDY